MKIFQPAYVVGSHAMAEPEGHTSQCDFFIRAKLRLQIISSVRLVSHTPLNDKRRPLDWSRRRRAWFAGLPRPE